MKDAMGELNMTVIVIVAIGAIAAFFMGVLWPNIQESIQGSWDNIGDNQYDDKGNFTNSIVIPNIYE